MRFGRFQIHVSYKTSQKYLHNYGPCHNRAVQKPCKRRDLFAGLNNVFAKRGLVAARGGWNDLE